MKIDKSKSLSLLGIVVASVVTTLFSNTLQEREIDKSVEKHLATKDENSKVEA